VPGRWLSNSCPGRKHDELLVIRGKHATLEYRGRKLTLYALLWLSVYRRHYALCYTGKETLYTVRKLWSTLANKNSEHTKKKGKEKKEKHYNSNS
jgi:hypothetical protein